LNDLQIINGIQNSDETAIGHAMDKYSRLMWSIAASVLANAATAEDIEECVADVFVYLWQNHEKYDEQRGGLKSWLSMVAKSKAIDRFRQLSKKSELSLNDEIAIGEIAAIDDIASAETKRELAAAVNALGEVDREIVIRRYYYDQKPKEIGAILDMEIKQVKNSLYRSKLKLREMLTN
jgi:RNA polymerase sigma-70 factor (ECF subfamily)